MTALDRNRVPLVALGWAALLALACAYGGTSVHRERPVGLIACSTAMAASALATVFGVARRREAEARPVRRHTEPAPPHAVAVDDGRREAELRQLQTMAAVGRLAGGVAHDFGNLLNVILGYGQLAHRKLPPGHPCRRHLDEILRAADRGAGLTRQLLGVSRDREPSAQVIDLGALVRDDERMLRRLVGEDVRLEVIAHGDAGRVRADRAQMGQALMNLVANARDAMPRGGTLTIEIAAATLSARDCIGREGAAPGKHVVLSVTDTGCGMDAATVARVFEPFFTTKAEGHGTGLGLAGVDAAVRRNGGFVAVRSAPGQGATFTVHLPQVEAAAEAPPASARARMQPGTEGVLLVEDDRALRLLIGEVLTSAGYRVFDAATPEEALVIGETERASIDLLLTDVVMPGMSGPDLVRRLTARRRDLPVLYMSGHSQTVLGGRGIVEPGSRILEKPFMADLLLSKIRDVLAEDAVA
jgi:two-component system, cell cycle sensor histidine kinase and response regulator CckA